MCPVSAALLVLSSKGTVVVQLLRSYSTRHGVTMLQLDVDVNVDVDVDGVTLLRIAPRRDS